MYPSVSAIIATNGKRPQLLRRAVESIFAQDYPGSVEVLVVFDRVDPDRLEDLSIPTNRSLSIVSNTRTGGLAGGRNSGILAAGGELIGFCDDDDWWMPAKLSKQVALWQQRPQAVAIASGISVRTNGQNIVRLAPERASFHDFLGSRITEIHPSALLYRRDDLLSSSQRPIGLVDEELPASYGEDYDLLLRATRFGDIYSVQEALIGVLWDRQSFFAGKWQAMADGLSYILRKFPEFEQHPRGLARIAGQVAYVHASLGHRAQAVAYARSALRRDPRQLRAWAALVVASGAVKGQTLLDAVQKTGRGL